MSQDRTTTRLFGAFDPNARGNEDFVVDLRRMVSLWGEAPKRSVFRDKLPTRLLTRTNREAELATKDLSTSTGEPPFVVKSATECASFFVRRFANKDYASDQPEELSRDLERLRLIDDSQVAAVTDLFRWLKEDVVPLVEAELRRRGAATGLVPSFKGLSTEVELRAVQEDSYDSTQSVDSYRPTILGLTPVVTIEIRSSDQDPYVFQVEKADLELISNYLKAALKDVEALEQYVAGNTPIRRNSPQE